MLVEANLSRFEKTVDNCHVTGVNKCMIKTFADRATQQVFIAGKSKRLPSDLIRRAVRRLEYIHYATTLSDFLQSAGSQAPCAQSKDRRRIFHTFSYYH